MSDDAKFILLIGAPFVASLLNSGVNLLASYFTHRKSRREVGEIRAILSNGHELKRIKEERKP